MAKEAGKTGLASPWRIAGWGTAALLLVLPLAMKAPWTASDFIFAGMLLGSLGLAFEFIVGRSDSIAYRLGAAVAAIAAFLTVWVNAAVGMIGSGDNPLNLLFGGVLLVALAGAIVARLEAAGMARAMGVAAILQAGAGAAGLGTDVRGGVLSMGFAGLWLLSSALFHNAAAAARAKG